MYSPTHISPDQGANVALRDRFLLKRWNREARGLSVFSLRDFVAAIGSQDQYLSVQGEVTFFKGVYRRHTNFAKEAVSMSFNQTPAWGQKSTATISRTGDLLSKTWLVVTLPAINPLITEDEWALSMTEYGEYPKDPDTGLRNNAGHYPGARYCDEVGHAMIDKIDLIIGGTTIDSHPGHWLQVWNELTCTEEKKKLDILIGKSGSEEELKELAKRDQTLYIPLQFFFCRHLMQCLPLIALQYHEVKIEVKFKQLREVVPVTGHQTRQSWLPSSDRAIQIEASKYPIKDCHLLCNLIYLEEEERRTFASSTHEYLVDLLQFQGEVETTTSMSTYHAFFNHPTTELIWTFVPKACLEAHEPFCYGALDKAWNLAMDPMKSAKLQFNGYDRFAAMGPEYFREIIPAQYHTAIPQKNIYCYSFALEPEDFRPSGSVNLSRIDNVKLILDHIDFSTGLKHPFSEHGQTAVKGANLRVYARSKNVLRIKSGMAGLAYAN